MASIRHPRLALASLATLALLLGAFLLSYPAVSADEGAIEVRSSASPLIVRGQPSFGAAYLGAVPERASVLSSASPATDEAGNVWYQVRFGDLDGWVQTEWAAPEPTATPEPEPTAVPDDSRTTEGVSSRSAQRPVDRTGDSIASMALGYVGYPYVYGGASPGGFDCSGLISYILGQHGISIGRSTFAQVNYGSWVDLSEAQPGDLVFFANTYTAGISHIGIYIGGGQFVDAESERTGVRINSLGASYWASHFAGIKRVR